MAKILDEMDALYEKIYAYRTDIATHKREKIEKRADAWKYAEGTAKEKEDYVRSVVSEFDEKIGFCEAEVERAYNKVKILEWKLEHSDEQ